jgi:6-pyruvoyltetrahydropterin/6-carboxytetrahydropterin synthase
MNKLVVQHYFDAAHQLTDSPDLVTKACARLHGHTYAVIVEAEAEKLNGAGMVVDFKAIKQIIDIFDHRYINDILAELNYEVQPTAENIAKVIQEEIVSKLNINVTKVSVCEGYKGVERASWAVYEPSKN